METNKHLIIFGTRPEWLKIKKIIKNNRKLFHIVYVGQHTDIFEKENIFYDEKIIFKKFSQNRNKNIIINCLAFDICYCYKSIIVQGDTSSALGFALNGFFNKIPVFHIEAGLRTFSKYPFPEENNRKIISQIAQVHFCPSKKDLKNLKKEKIKGEKHIVGNTSIDNLKNIKTKTKKQVLITLHRGENKKNIIKILNKINKEAKKYPNYNFIFYKHPSVRIKKKFSYLKIFNNLPHKKFIKKVSQSLFVITDSGGIQEECCFLNKKVLIFRKETERFCDKKNYILTNLSNLASNIKYVISNPEIKDKKMKFIYGNGQASYKILKILKNK